MIVNYFKRLSPDIKEWLKDPDMCASVKILVDDSVDSIWPEIESHLLFELRLSMQKPVLVETQPEEYPKLCSPCCYLRTCFRYNYDPVDISIWKRLKRWQFWLIYIMDVFPFYAIQPLFRTFIWLMIDKSDEFQLVTFIVEFKRLQFFTLGGLGSIAGFFLFYGCVYVRSDLNSNSSMEIISCVTAGPFTTVLLVLEVSEKNKNHDFRLC